MRSSRLFVLVALILVSLLVGCAKKSPEEQLIDARLETDVRLNAWTLRETPLAVEVVEEEGEEGESEEATEDALPVPPPTRTDLLLDLIAKRDREGLLPGITVDVTQVDSSQKAQETYRVWVSFDGIPGGTATQVTTIIEDVQVDEGDAFAAEVRALVPVGEREDYPEFASTP